MTMSHNGALEPEGGQPPPRKPWLVIEPRSAWSVLDWVEIWKYRDLLLTFALRDVKLRYRQTALGVVWVILQPLLAAGIFTVVFGYVARLPTDGIPYFVFSFGGLLAWNVFSNTMTRASNSLVDNAQLISKVFFPRMILPLSMVFSVLLDFAVAACLMAAILIAQGITPGWGFLLLPVWLIMLVMLGIGIGLYTSALMVPYRDLRYVIPVLLQFLLYASPVAYSVASVPASLLPFFFLNPVSGLLEAFRWSLLDCREPNWGYVAYSALCSLVILGFGAYSFKKMERRFADII